MKNIFGISYQYCRRQEICFDKRWEINSFSKETLSKFPQASKWSLSDRPSLQFSQSCRVTMILLASLFISFPWTAVCPPSPTVCQFSPLHIWGPSLPLCVCVWHIFNTEPSCCSLKRLCIVVFVLPPENQSDSIFTQPSLASLIAFTQNEKLNSVLASDGTAGDKKLAFNLIFQTPPAFFMAMRKGQKFGPSFCQLQKTLIEEAKNLY